MAALARPTPEDITPTEREILRLVLRGATNREIARSRGIAETTVKKHLANVNLKLGTTNRTEAIRRAVEAGVIEWEGVASPGDGQPLLAPPHGLAWLVAGVAIAALMAVGAWVAWWPHTPTRSPPPPVQKVWTPSAALPDATAGLAGAVIEGRLYVFGGRTPEGVSRQALALNMGASSPEWAALPDKPTPVTDAGAAVVGGRIYVFGGCDHDSAPSDVVEVYEPRSRQWSSGPRMPVRLCGFGVAGLEGQVYLFGGQGDSGYVDTVLSFDPRDGRWRSVDTLPGPRAYAAAAAVSDSAIAVLGGVTPSGQLLQDHLLYRPFEPRGERWQNRRPLTEPRAGLAAVQFGERLYVVGGGWEGPAGGLLHYDPVREAWLDAGGPEPVPWRGAVLAGFSDVNRLYVVGGLGASGQFDQTVSRAIYFLP